MNREQAIDAAQIRANQTGERWYAIRVKHIGEQVYEESDDALFKNSYGLVNGAERDEWVFCDEPTSGTYIHGQQKICVFPVSVNRSRHYGMRKGGHIAVGSAKHR